MNQMKAQSEELMSELPKSNAENEELKHQLQQIQLSMLNNRESRELDFAKFQIQEQNKMQLETAKLQMQGAKIDTDAMLKQQEINIKEAESDMQRQEDTNDAYIQGIEDTIGGAV